MISDRSRRLRGRKVILRPKELGDAARDYEWARDIELMRLDAAEPCGLNFSEYLSLYPEGLSDVSRVQYAVETESGRHIGNCTVYNINEELGETEMGVMIGDREYWGKGYGSDTVRTILRHIFEEMGLRRVFLHTLDWNDRGMICFERCGFVPCGRIMIRGQEFIRMEVLDGVGSG